MQSVKTLMTFEAARKLRACPNARSIEMFRAGQARVYRSALGSNPRSRVRTCIERGIEMSHPFAIEAIVPCHHYEDSDALHSLIFGLGAGIPNLIGQEAITDDSWFCGMEFTVDLIFVGLASRRTVFTLSPNSDLAVTRTYPDERIWTPQDDLWAAQNDWLDEPAIVGTV